MGSFVLSRFCSVFPFSSQPAEPQFTQEELGAEYARRVLRGEEAARALGLTHDVGDLSGEQHQPGAAPADAGAAEEEGEEEDEEEEGEEELDEVFADEPEAGEEVTIDRDEGGPADQDDGQAHQNRSLSTDTPRSTARMASQLLEKVPRAHLKTHTCGLHDHSLPGELAHAHQPHDSLPDAHHSCTQATGNLPVNASPDDIAKVLHLLQSFAGTLTLFLDTCVPRRDSLHTCCAARPSPSSGSDAFPTLTFLISLPPARRARCRQCPLCVTSAPESCARLPNAPQRGP